MPICWILCTFTDGYWLNTTVDISNKVVRRRLHETSCVWGFEGFWNPFHRRNGKLLSLATFLSFSFILGSCFLQDHRLQSILSSPSSEAGQDFWIAKTKLPFDHVLSAYKLIEKTIRCPQCRAHIVVGMMSEFNFYLTSSLYLQFRYDDAWGNWLPATETFNTLFSTLRCGRDNERDTWTAEVGSRSGFRFFSCVSNSLHQRLLS